jgi:hypothetical protein
VTFKLRNTLLWCPLNYTTPKSCTLGKAKTKAARRRSDPFLQKIKNRPKTSHRTSSRAFSHVLAPNNEATSLPVHRRVLLGSPAWRITRSRLILAACEREVSRARPVCGLVRLLAQGTAKRWVRTPASFRAAGDRARVVVCQVRLRADGTGRGGFAEGSWVAKELAADHNDSAHGQP